MRDALLDAELLAHALVRGLSGATPLPLAAYGRRRDARAGPMHRLTAGLATLALPPPAQLEVMVDMASDPIAVGRFLGAMAGSVPVEEVFGPPRPAAEAA